MSPVDRSSPAGGLVHVGVAIAILVLVLNDHVLKHAFPSVVTGKLSDFAGLAFFPLLLEAPVEVVLAMTGRYRGPSRARLVACIVITGVCFAWMKTTESGERTYELGLGAIRWPFEAVASLVVGRTVPHLSRASIVRDPSDLVALLALVLAYRIGSTRRTEP